MMTSPVIVKPDKAIKGNDFDFNSINDNNFLTVITSKLGMPPKVFWQFFYQLKMASKNASDAISLTKAEFLDLKTEISTGMKEMFKMIEELKIEVKELKNRDDG